MIVRLREWRERRKLSLRQLAERAGVHYVTIVSIEAGRMSPTVETLEKLANALDIQLRDFFPVERQSHKQTRRDAR
jgi:transcriptional regulator with XRE-family HTH domain